MRSPGVGTTAQVADGGVRWGSTGAAASCDVVGQSSGVAAADQYVWHHRDDGACLVPRDRAPPTPRHGEPDRGAVGASGRCLCWMGGCVRCRRVWWGSCMWPVRGWVWVCGSGGVDGVAVCGVPVRGCRGRGCIAPGIWCAGALMGSWIMWGARMSRSRSAGIASSAVRCRRRWLGWLGWRRRWWLPARTGPGRSVWWGM